MSNGGDWVCLALALTPAVYFIVEGARQAHKAKLRAQLRQTRITLGLPERSGEDRDD